MKKTYSKIIELLTPAERRSAILLLCLMIIGMIAEMIGIGLVVPVIALLTQQDIISNYPFLHTPLKALGNPSQEVLIISVMLFLVAGYLLKNLFLAFLAWQQTRFIFGLKAELSQRLFALYLKQPYTFHLQRNSAQLIRNVQTEVNMFTNSAMTAGTHIIAESLVLFGVSVLLLVVEPLGIVIVVVMLGVAAFGFHNATKGFITRWGEARQYHDGMSILHLHQGLGGAKDVKLLGREFDFLI